MKDDTKEKEIINFINVIKSSFYASIDTFYEIQELSEKVLMEMTGKSKDLQEDGEKVLREFLETTKKGREDFRTVMETGFRQIEDFFNSNKKTLRKKSGQ